MIDKEGAVLHTYALESFVDGTNDQADFAGWEWASNSRSFWVMTSSLALIETISKVDVDSWEITDKYDVSDLYISIDWDLNGDHGLATLNELSPVL